MMKGLLTKEILVLIKNNKYQLAIILMFAVLGVVTKSFAYMLFIPLLLPMLIVQGLSFDETSKWDMYSICFPADRKKLVSAKYLMLTIAAIASAVILFVSLTILKASGGLSGENIGVYLIGGIACSLIAPSLILPFDFKFGVAKGKIIFYIITGLVTVSISALIMQGDNTSFLYKLTTTKMPTLILLAASTVVFIISWFISATVYENKEI